jgi:hypothetical protein
MEELNQHFLLKPDHSTRSFLEKLHDQLQNVSDDAVRIAVDALAFHLLYPMKFSANAKLEILKTIFSWRPSIESELTDVEAAFEEGGIGYPGTFYNTGRPDLFAFLLQLGRLTLANPTKARDDDWLIEATEKAVGMVERNVGMQRNVALHVMLPDRFERIAVDWHKEAITKHFADLTRAGISVDEQLTDIRHALVSRYNRPDFDFYDEDIQIQWDPTKPRSPAPPPRPPLQSAPQVWIEKTIVSGRPDRVDGEYALGKMLWSPQRSRNDADMYRFMRDVRAGDTVLHLTDNEGFTGISIADSVAQEFNGLPETEWSDRPSYFIRLRDYRPFEPPLLRNVFLQSPFKERLLQLLEGGLRNTFYARDGNLNQGAYLTPAGPSLLRILNDAYRSIAGKDLVNGVAEVPEENPPREASSPPAPPILDLRAIVESFATALANSHISFGERHIEVVRSFVASLAAKPFVILTGLSGSGKTQLAIRFGEWLGPGRSRVIAVRPDWTGPEQLLGYEDALQKTDGPYRGWYVPDALSFILTAANDPESPYLLVLDEMNLAHVERYFADVLSGMESSEPCIPNLVRVNGVWRSRPNAAEKIAFPDNLFIVGTVNVDETTYNFSPKVLDRANTIEFRVDSSEFNIDAKKPTNCQPGPQGLVMGFLQIARDSEWHQLHPMDESEHFTSALIALHSRLSEGRFEFGHRIFFEALRFGSIFNEAGARNWKEALDFVLLQKILPRLHGSRRNLEPTLTALDAFCNSIEPLPPGDSATPALPRAQKRVQRFIRILNANQFASFSD